MGGSDGAFNVYLRTFKVREELEAKAKKAAEQNPDAKPLVFTESARYSADSKAASEFFSNATTAAKEPSAA